MPSKKNTDKSSENSSENSSEKSKLEDVKVDNDHKEEKHHEKHHEKDHEKDKEKDNKLQSVKVEKTKKTEKGKKENIFKRNKKHKDSDSDDDNSHQMGEKKKKVDTKYSFDEARSDEEVDETKVQKVKETFEKLESSPKGLTNEEAEKRIAQYGPNLMKKTSKSPFLLFFSTMWNPLSWVMEIAAIVSIALQDYVDFALILILLLFNSTISFVEALQAGKAISVLLKSLAPSCLCLRDGSLDKSMPAEKLVPGDIVKINIGCVVPADCILFEGSGLLVDESSLTGESMPVEKSVGAEIFSGSVVKRGEMLAVVHATGQNTFFGKSASLVAGDRETGQFHLILKQVGYFCISIIAVGVLIELVVQFGYRKEPCVGKNCSTLNNALVLIVGGIPIAMPTVLSVTLAIGAHQLAKSNVIVSRLTSIEDLSGMDMLCSDKTGTLTKNELTITDPVSYSDKFEGSDILYYAALSVPESSVDPIDIALLNALSDDQKEERKKSKHLKYSPFHPKKKTTSAKIQAGKEIFSVTKGAPQNVLEAAANKNNLYKKVNKDIEEFGKRGYRAIGVSLMTDKDDEYKIIGLIPLYDPPRDDTKAMIEATKAKGIDIKMITGDQLAIAVETSRQLGLKTNILIGDLIRDKEKCFQEQGVPLKDLIEEAGGFAQVYPEDKYTIVKQLQKNGHIVAMTGDGVNDTPALKKANIGIAVHGASDAARSAADIVLANPGLSVIVDAIVGSRKIFKRIRSYCIYSISMAVRVVVTFVILTTAFNWYFPTLAVVFLAILNDACMISISRDNVTPSETPDTWNSFNVFFCATMYGIYLSISTIVLFSVATQTTFFQNTFGLVTLNPEQLVGLMYVNLSVGGLATIFITRSYGFSFLDRPGLYVILAFGFAQVVASFLGAYGLNGYEGFDGAGWGYVLVGWVWSIVWYFPLDFIKVGLYRLKDSKLWKQFVFHHTDYSVQQHPSSLIRR